MKIQADKEWVELISQACDALLKSHGNKILYIVNKLLWSIEHIENKKKVVEDKPLPKEDK